MASHWAFRTFQRNQKAWLAGIGVATMVSFILLPVILQLFSQGGSTGISTVAKCRSFGNLTNQQLNGLREERETLRRFFRVLGDKLADPADETKMNSLRPLAQYIQQFDRRQDEETLVNNWLIAQYAKQQGLRADWAVVSDLLKQLTVNYLTDAIYQSTLSDIGISHQRLEYLLGQDIVRQQFLERFQLSMSAVSPVTRWEWYQRLYRQVTLEVLGVPVAKYVDKVAEPSEAELRAFFEEHKKEHYSPDFAEPGFIQPTEIGFYYVVATPNQKMLDSITEDEIKKFYEDNKDAFFRKPVNPINEQRELPGLPGLGSTTVPFPAPPKPAEQNIGTPNPETKTEQPAVGSPKDEPKKDELKKEEPKKEEPQQEEPKKTSALSCAKMKFVSYASDGEQKPEPAAAAPTESAPNDIVMPTTDKPIDLAILYRPYDEVKDDIRKMLATEKASKVLPVIQAKMREFARSYHPELEKNGKAPQIPDFTKLVADNDLELKIVPRNTAFENIKSDFAKGIRERSQLIKMYSENPMLFESEIFAGSNGEVLVWITELKKEFKPAKLEEVKDIVLKTWKEVKARPLAVEAAEKLVADAKKSGKSLAETFKDQKDIEVVKTEPFSWKTYGAGIHPLAALMQGQRPFLDEVRESGVAVGNALINNKVVFAPGNDFMEKVFSLQLGETSSVLNQPELIAYVVRVNSSTPSEEVLWERFQTAYLLEYAYAGQPEIISEAMNDFLQKIYAETGFQWVNKPNAVEED